MEQPKEILCVYQDCHLCGSKGQTVKDIASAAGLSIRKVSFASEEGKELIHQALFEHNVKQMPFYTDGQHFAATLTDLIAKFSKKPQKRGIKSIKNAKGAKNELDR